MFFYKYILYTYMFIYVHYQLYNNNNNNIISSMIMLISIFDLNHLKFLKFEYHSNNIVIILAV